MLFEDNAYSTQRLTQHINDPERGLKYNTAKIMTTGNQLYRIHSMFSPHTKNTK